MRLAPKAFKRVAPPETNEPDRADSPCFFHRLDSSRGKIRSSADSAAAAEIPAGIRPFGTLDAVFSMNHRAND
jgi:hypothetical protein